MDYIRITDENIEKEHICCAMSGKQGVIKKEWLKQRFKEGLVFCRSTERGKCFIEYIPAENAWVPIQADGYFYIDCRLAERAWIFQRSAGRVHPGRKEAGAKGTVHSLVRGAKAGVSLRPEVSGI